MTKFLWDGPSDSDEEITEFNPLRNEYEKKMDVKYSKRSIIDFVEKLVSEESPHNPNKKVAKLWEEKMKEPNRITLFLKNGGSKFNDSQPFIRTESVYPKAFKLHKLIEAVS